MLCLRIWKTSHDDSPSRKDALLTFYKMAKMSGNASKKRKLVPAADLAQLADELKSHPREKANNVAILISNLSSNSNQVGFLERKSCASFACNGHLLKLSMYPV